MNVNIIQKILIANRGEIARRIIRSCRKMGIETLALYTPDEKDAAWKAEADFVVDLGEGNLSDTYLNIEKILTVAKNNHCDALHPGYGFLAENAAFAKACTNKDITFIGPKADVIELMGNKLQAREFVKNIDIPLPFGITGTVDEILSRKDAIILPAIIKSAAGGGGKGMHIVRSFDGFDEKLKQASKEAEMWFGNGEIFIEQYFENARHIEVQVLSDEHGNHRHLFERECTLQRNYQKVIEEAPSPTLNEEQRKAITEAAVKVCEASNYTNAGTIEFLWENGNFYFLEMNTRIQVEHPVTEQITGIDLVEEQINIARNEKISFDQNELSIQGHAVEARIYAEQPQHNFKPSAGFMHHYEEAKDLPLRFDSTYSKPSEISTAYDGLITKLIAHRNTRHEAIALLKEGIDKTQIHGIHHNGAFIKELLNNDLVLKNQIHTKFITEHFENLTTKQLDNKNNMLLFAAIIAFENQINNKKDNLWQITNGLEKVKHHRFLFNESVHNILVIQDDKHLTIKQNSVVFNFKYDMLNRSSIRLVIGNEIYAIHISQGEEAYWVQLNDEIYTIKSQSKLNYVSISKKEEAKDKQDYFEIKSPLHGKVSNIFIEINQWVKQGEPILSIESMKTDNQIMSPADGMVEKILIENNKAVKEKQLLITFKN